ncbi:MAG: propionyl-CoA synthetase, partial [Acidobacteria bacterium]|nr:propionyl-CoA synthetase [Acidobacteriota bacterium]
YLSKFPGFYETGDAGYIDDDGYVFVMSRTDDIINVAGHRLSTGAIEEVLAAHQDVAECAVVGVADDLKGQLPVGLLVLKAGVERSADDVIAEVISMVWQRIGPIAVFKKAVVIDCLPKTRSGKILRGTMRKIADSEEFRTPATIEDPDVLDEVRHAMQSIGYASPDEPA